MQNESVKDLIIIGAGLSGLYAAKLLEPYYRVTILEAQDRPGGRIHTIDGHDMGPSWIWPHQKQIQKLLHQLGLSTFSQYTSGHSLYDTGHTPTPFAPPEVYPSSRVEGGLVMLVDKLIQSLEHTTIRYDTRVTNMTQKGAKLLLQTDQDVLEADRVIVAMAPRVALTITYEPQITESDQKRLAAIPTWMAHTAKCVITFDKPFWRDEALSGFAISHTGPLSEIHDASTKEEAALFGFAHSHAKIDEEAVMTQLIRLFGPKAMGRKAIHIADWRDHPYTSSVLDGEPLRSHPQYGLDMSHFNDKLHFCGTESAFIEGGYLEGALEAATNVASKLLPTL